MARYETGFDTTSAERIALMAELGTALDEGQLELWYQPQASLQDGAIVGAEALVRWNHPTRGLVSPGAFVPFAEVRRPGLRFGQSIFKCPDMARRLCDLRPQQLDLLLEKRRAPTQVSAGLIAAIG